MLAVLGPVPLDHLPLPGVSPDREADAQDVVTRLDQPEDPPDPLPLLVRTLPGLQVLRQLVLHDTGSAVEEPLHHGEKVRVVPVYGLAVAAQTQQEDGRRENRVSGGAAGPQEAASSPGEWSSEVPEHFDIS